ncbi:MAG: EAL domain-containing protein [gamma proteobacterium symbiont of Taylorina sp.]|nr:EAL domain-containing protein [gamma proteobacterium symbiont of Taylorina sp.]
MNKNTINIEKYYSNSICAQFNSNLKKHIAPSILVVDDEKLVRQSVQDLLEIYDLECTQAEDGQKALEIMADRSFDIILLDLKMPKVDGFQVMKIAQDQYPDIDIIVNSGEATFDNAALSLRYGVKEFLNKPYNPTELITIIDNLLEKRTLKRNLDEMHRCIHASEKRYGFFVNNSPDMIYMLDKEGHFAFVNERASELLGYTQEEFIGHHYAEFIHADDIEKARCAFSTHTTDIGIKQTIELRMQPKHPGADLCYFESRSISIQLNTDDMPDNRLAEDFIGIYGVARDISEQKRLDEIAYFHLYHDALTELPNRVLFSDRVDFAISQANRHNKIVAIMFLDMDRFKIINDSLGHIAGDKLIQEIAKRLKSCIRDSDTLARVGGDEFNLMLPDINSCEDVTRLINNITCALESSFSIEGNEIYVTFSIGTATFPEDGENSEALIKHADMAMYAIKGKGKNGHKFFSELNDTLFQHHLSIENGIRTALQENQFEVYFQPQYDVIKEKINGVEALIRWNHPEKGLITPNDFIPLAEETGLINDIGEWMLDSSCKILQQWVKHNPALSHIKLAVNMSASQVGMESFVDFVLDTMKKYDIKGEQLELEITENVLMQDMEQVVIKLKYLASHGICFAVDDFGMGYSSLSYLQTLPLNNLKIDRAFISTIQSPGDKNSIITAIVAMAKELGMHIVAEGVETQVQLDYVRAIGCPTVQGYWYGRPMPTHQVKDIAIEQLG